MASRAVLAAARWRAHAHLGVAAAAAIAAAAGGSILAAGDDRSAPITLQEHRTGQKFELHRPGPRKTACTSSQSDADMHLIGANTRCMLGWCKLAIARAYAFGLYLDDDAILLGRQLAAQRRSTTTTTADSTAGSAASTAAGAAAPAAPVSSSVRLSDLFDAKERSPGSCEVALVLRMARDIAGGHLQHGFLNSTLARAQKMAKQRLARSGTASAGASTAASAASAAAAELLSVTASGGALESGKAMMAAAPGASPPTLPAAASFASGSGGASAAGGSPASSSLSSSLPSTGGEPLTAELTRFANAFIGIDFAVGDEVAFVWRRDGTCAVYMRGVLADGTQLIEPLVAAAADAPPTAAASADTATAAAGGASAVAAPAKRRVPDATLRNPLLVRALFDVYAGDDAPVSARAKATFERNWADLLASDGLVRMVERPLVTAQSASDVAPVPAAAAGGAAGAAGGGGGGGSVLDRLEGWLDRLVEGVKSSDRGLADSAALPAASPAAAVKAMVPAIDAAAVERIVLAEHASRIK